MSEGVGDRQFAVASPGGVDEMPRGLGVSAVTSIALAGVETGQLEMALVSKSWTNLGPCGVSDHRWRLKNRIAGTRPGQR